MSVMSRGRKPWTEREDQVLLKLIKENLEWTLIGERLGRTADQCQGRNKILRQARERTPEERSARAARQRAYYARTKAMLTGEEPIPPRVDPAALEDRDHRLGLAPRDLVALFAGDPLPGYSALDRRAA